MHRSFIIGVMIGLLAFAHANNADARDLTLREQLGRTNEQQTAKPPKALPPRPHETTSKSSTERKPQERRLNHSWLTTLGGLAVVVTLILTTAYLFRKHAPVAVKILPAEAVQVLGRRFLDQKHCIQLVRCGSRILVLASSPQHGLSTLSEITDPVEVDQLAGLCRQEAADSITNQFGQLLGRFHDQGRRSSAGRAATHGMDDENPFDNLEDPEVSSRPEPARGTMHG